MEKMKWIDNHVPKSDDRYLSLMSHENISNTREFHKSFPQYWVTPLANLKGMAEYLGIAGLFVKDESFRFNLNSFKALGGTFAIANYIAEKMGKDITEMTYDYLTSEKFRKEFGQATFITATDGNHGRGVAWAANRLGQKCIVHMPRGSSHMRYDNIAREGARVTIEDANYDECVRIAAKEAETIENSVVVQDTAWEGYTKIPNWIMQGYATMALEASDQFREVAMNRPTHIFVQAGVGSMASAVVAYFANVYKEDPPTFVVMEPTEAACMFKSATIADGEPHSCTGDMHSIMAGLCCGEPNLVSWDILKNHVSAFISCPEWVTAKGMRMLATPVKGDPVVISGESGAVGMGVVASILKDESYKDLREHIGLDRFSQVLLFSTEGNTDRDQFRRIVWDGEYPSI